MHNLKRLLFKYKEIILFLLILSLSCLTRFYQAVDLFPFTTDEELGLALAQTIVNNFHIIWVGESAANVGFYMGPFWVYFTALWLYLTGSDPAFLAYIAAGIGVITAAVLFLVARSMFNLKVAVIASFLYAALPLTVYFDRKYWLLSPSPLLAILLIFSLYKTKQSLWWWVLIGFLYGMVFHVHLSLAILGLLIVWRLWQQKALLFGNKKIVCAALLIFLLVVSPLIVFDYFKKGQNILTPIRMVNLTSQQKNSFNPWENIGHLFRSYGRIWYLQSLSSNADEVLHACSPFYLSRSQHKLGSTTTYTMPFIILSLLSILIGGYFLLLRTTWTNDKTQILALAFCLLIFGFVLLPNVALEYYLLGSFTLFFIITACVVDSLKKWWQYLSITMVICLGSLGVYTIIRANADFGMSAKISLVKKVMSEIGNNTFEIKEDGLCQTDGGWRPIFIKYGRKPDQSPTDRTIGYLYPNEITKGRVAFAVYIVESRIDTKYWKNKDKNMVSSGGFTAYIYKK